MLAENTTSVDFDKLIGQRVSFGIQGADPGQTPRTFTARWSSCRKRRADPRLTCYSMTVVPDIWRLGHIFRSRIFQHVNVPDILKKIIHGFRCHL